MASRRTRKPSRRSTRRGQIRKTSRRAYTKRRSNPRPYRRRAAPRRAPKRAVRRRSNPRPLLQQPAVRYGAAAVAGAAVSAYLNTWAAQRIAEAGTNGAGLAGLLRPKMGEEGARLHAGVVGAALTIGLSMLPQVKAKTRNNLLAAGVGMLTQPAIEVTRNLTTRAQEQIAPPAVPVTKIRAPIVARKSSAYRSNVHYNAAAFVGVPVS